MKTIHRITPLLGSIALLVPAQAADTLRSNNNATGLNTGAAWQGGVVPGAADVIVFDGTGVPAAATATTVTASNVMGAALDVLGIRVANNVGGTVNTTQYLAIHNNILTGSGTSFTLSLGSAGVDMSAANHSLRIQAAIALTASQNWTVTNANTGNNVMGFNNSEDLSFDATSAAQAFNLGGFTVNASGTGAINITSGYTISNGTINISNPYFVVQGGGNRVTNINNDVTLNVATGGVLHFQSNSGAGGASFASNATINLNGGQLRLAANNATNTLNVGGIINVNSASTLNIGKPLTNNGAAGPINITGNLAGAGALSFLHNVPTAPSAVTLSGNNSGYTGTISFSGTAGRVTRLSTATAGSASATWNVGTGHTVSLNAVAVDFGALTGAGGISTYAAGTSTASVGAGSFSGVLSNGTGTLALAKVGAGTLTLTGANTYTGTTTVNAGTLITTPAQTGATTVTSLDGATFGVSLATAGTTFNVGTLNVGSLDNGRLSLALGTLGNPTAPVISATSFNPVANTFITLAGSNFALNSQFPLIDYTGAIGGGGFGSLQLVLPFRTSGNLVDNIADSRVDAVITGQAVPTWRGNVNGNWDIDNVGDGSIGTGNWFATSGPSTYVQGAPVGTDAVLFDDTATGLTNVNLTTTLAPNAITFNNTTKNYTLSGSGKLSGTSGILKNGDGILIIANTTANDFTGATTINAGTLRIGDGVTVGAGSLPGSGIVANGGLTFDRPDDYTQAGTITGSGSIRKNHASTTTLTGAVTFGGGINLTDGTLAFTGGGTLSGPITGSGQITKSGATLTINGTAANTNTGLVATTGGRLDLATPAGVDAIGGDILIAGNGQLGLLASEVVPNTSSITVTSTSTDSIPTQTGQETFLNATLNSATSGAAGGQIIMRNNMTILGIATVQSGVFGVASGQTGTINAVNITSAPGNAGILRIAGNSAASTLHIGAGGITASGGEIQVKFNTNNFDAILNLGGDFTATGNVAITNAGYTGVNQNIINLLGTRTFSIAAGTTTTVAPDIGGSGDLIKDGEGTLSLEALNTSTHAGATGIADGTLLVKGTVSGTSALNVAGGILSGNGTIAIAPGGGALFGPDGQLAPGTSVGTLTLNLSSGGSLDFGAALLGDSDTFVYELDTELASDKLIVAGGPVNIGSGQLEFDDFLFSTLAGFANDTTYTLIDGDAPIQGSFGPDISGTVGGLPATLSFADGGNDLVLVVPEPGSAILLLGGLVLLARRRERRR